MFSYTTSAAYSAGTSYRKTESDSFSFQKDGNNDYPGVAEFENGYPARYYSRSESGSGEIIKGADGGITHNNQGAEGHKLWVEENDRFTDDYHDESGTASNLGGYTQTPDGEIKGSSRYERSDAWGLFDRNTGKATQEIAYTENINGRTQSGRNVYANGNGNSYSTTTSFPTSSRQIQTSTTTTYKYYPASTKQTTLYNKKGTTTTAGTITFPTTTETSWIEITITNTTKTKTSTVATTTSEASHKSIITAHTVIHVADGETLYTLIQSPNIGTPFTGTENWQSIQGPDTITISRWPCTTYQCAVLDASAEPFDSNASETSSTKTRTEMNGVETTNVTSYYKTTEGLPLKSSSFEGAGAIIKTTSETYVVVSYPAPTTATSQRVAVTQTATHNASIGGVAFPVNGKAETANVTVQIPILRSFSTNTATRFGPIVEDEDGYTQDIGYVENNANAQGFAEEGNFFVAYGVHNFPNNGGISDAYLRRAYAWATVGDGTSATAEPKQSWTIANVSKVTWEAVSVSDGVATPWPVFGVETTSTTTSTAENQTKTSTSTATATTAIWGNVYRRKTSSSNSSGVTTSVNTTQLDAGGNGHTMLELGGLPALPTPAYIPSPVGSVLPVFGAAHVDDKRTVIILPAEYANTTISSPETYGGSTLPETYFETKSPPQIVLEGQGGAVQRLESLW